MSPKQPLTNSAEVSSANSDERALEATATNSANEIINNAPSNGLKSSEIDAITDKFDKTDIKNKENKNNEALNKSSTPDSSQSAGTKNRPAAEIDGKRVMLVAAKSRVKQVAGSIARTVREEEGDGPPILSAVGAASVNQAIKSIAIARDFLSGDKIDLAVEVVKRPQEEVKDVIVFTLTQHEKGSLLNGDEEVIDYQDMRAASNSTPGSLAGAIAFNVRNKKNPRITAIGQKPVFKAVLAVCVARNYLKKDGIDLDIVPRFVQVTFDNGHEANAIQIIVLSRDADTDAEEN